MREARSRRTLPALPQKVGLALGVKEQPSSAFIIFIDRTEILRVLSAWSDLLYVWNLSPFGEGCPHVVVHLGGIRSCVPIEVQDTALKSSQYTPQTNPITLRIN